MRKSFTIKELEKNSTEVWLVLQKFETEIKFLCIDGTHKTLESEKVLEQVGKVVELV